jgi:uncharacterized membrane protein (UPF0127 family)
MRILILLTLLSVLSASPLQASTEEDVTFGIARLMVGDYPTVLNVELASTDAQRARGLMFRDSLCEQCGMLFDFNQSRYVGMWMKDTFIPLSVAYFTEDGVIVNIRQMQPHTLQSHPSDAPVRFALEMPQGWFAKQQITPGDKVKILSLQPRQE